MSKGIIWVAAAAFSWSLLLMPVLALLGQWTVLGWVALAALLAGPMLWFELHRGSPGSPPARIASRQREVRRGSRPNFRPAPAALRLSR